MLLIVCRLIGIILATFVAVNRRATSLVGVFAANLRRYRLDQSLTQEGLAERAGLHRTYVGAAERGERNVSLRAIERLARGLGIPARDLLDERRGGGR